MKFVPLYAKIELQNQNMFFAYINCVLVAVKEGTESVFQRIVWYLCCLAIWWEQHKDVVKPVDLLPPEGGSLACWKELLA